MTDIRIAYKGAEYVIPESRAFEIGEMVEDIAPLAEVLSWSKKPRFFKMARCLGAMLRFAGANVTDREVHTELMAQFLSKDAHATMSAVFALTNVLMDGVPRGNPGAPGGDAPEKTDAS